MVLSREVTARIKEVMEKHPEGISITDLVKSVDINRNTAGRYLENMLLSGQVEMRRFGMAKMYSLTKRLPVSSVLSISSELVLQLDIGERIFYANDPLLSFIGVPAKDLFGKNIEFTPFSIVFEEVFPELLNRFRRGLQGEEWRGELSRPVRGRYFLCRIAPTVTNEGKKGVSVLLEDISDQKRDEERIRTSEARLRSIFMASPVGIGVVSGRVLLEVNDRLCQMTGYSSGELIGRSARMLYPSEEEFDRVGSLLYNQLQQSGTGSVEIQWARKDGKIIDILLSSTPLDQANISGGITFTALDITERKRAEESLRESEEKFRALFNNANDMITLHGIDPDGLPGQYLEVNDEACRRLNYTRNELLAMSPKDIVAPESASEIGQNVEMLRKNRHATFEMVHLTKDGQRIPVEVSAHLFEFYGKPMVLALVRNITERKYIEEVLRESEERYRSVFENTGAATAIVEENTIISLVNEEFARLSGYTKREIEKKKSWTEFVAKEDLGLMLAQHYLRREGGDVLRRYEFRFIRKGGEIRHALLTVDLIPGTTQTICSLLDITDSKLADEQLLQREQQYRFIADNSLDIINRQTPEFVCTYVSPAITPVLGYSEVEVLGKSTLTMVHPHDRERVQSELAAVSKNGAGNLTLTFRLRHRDGHFLWFESMMKIIRDEKTGRIQEFLSISRDVTWRIRSGKGTGGD
jgi:PAS domain S-box-containing protein